MFFKTYSIQVTADMLFRSQQSIKGSLALEMQHGEIISDTSVVDRIKQLKNEQDAIRVLLVEILCYVEGHIFDMVKMIISSLYLRIY